MTDEMKEAKRVIKGLLQIIEDADVLIHKAVDHEIVKASDRLLASTEDTGGEFCEWWCDDEPFGDGYDMWESSCGVAYQFTSDGPKENHHNYCHKCGKPIRLSTEVTHEQRKP